MEIGIIGSGAIGLLFGFHLSENHSVRLYTRRKEQAEALNRDGIVLKNLTGDNRQRKISADTSDNYQEEFLIVAVKQYQLKEIAASLKGCRERKKLLFLQNGMDHLSILKELSQQHDCYAGVVEHGARKESENTVKHTGMGKTNLGSFGTGAAEELALQLDSPAFPFQWKENCRVMLAEKLLINTCINPLTALLGIKNGELISNSQYNLMMRSVFEEAFAILKLTDKEKSWDKVQEICAKTHHNVSSMLADIQSGRVTEIDAILGYLIKLSPFPETNAPIIVFLYRSIKGKETS
ncbi:2-dehydropantoate 2-reductase [Bacillus lacus]|uniref:2-dehydropantoate 2-reductase n=1 Tax=Metabacillus lacus TaxID=1983721 RepID=A0A7X2LVV9_9BACI|nr:2-dehydropantoate 2-reductase [Metabacillus lacus]MRX70820.1 2-dehydropantoate 2-reductase [Metabacillus lacus]